MMFRYGSGVCSDINGRCMMMVVSSEPKSILLAVSDKEGAVCTLKKPVMPAAIIIAWGFIIIGEA